ncbi:fungal-specific transcription factor domain-containing protein [Crepidotus variabilis]|uniref:Fungal-specific transcription factor domain-containing protein n=1 Tax=Crepidotus variabilis TaxID=179855 RepID=A0A9P6EMF0_9AGAR|nr:fungal-specific transcription factor domain-containing protein [Crepidotus variabilis]
MAYRSDTTSPAATPSPSSSTNASPYIHSTPLDPMAHDDQDSSSAQGTPNHSTSSLPRTQTAGKGGCWTCRVRRKKCDEQREGDSCKTCKRLTIKCLGWGPKRPDWMRDKKAVDDYKASIKAQLSRAGLIRGQPRLNPLGAPHRPRQTSQSTPSRRYRTSTATIDLPTVRSTHEQQVFQHSTFNESLLPGVPGPLHFESPLPPLVFDNSSDFLPNNLSLEPVEPISDFDIPQENSFLGGDYVIQPTMQDLVMHYFQNVRELQFLFAGETLNDVTCTAVCNEAQGAVSLAVCALADLHLKQLRVSQGLEAPMQSSDHSSTSYLRMEALQRLEINRNAQHGWSDTDALAALHLVSLSQLSGGTTDWEAPFNILCQWFLQTNLHHAENPWVAFLSLSPTAQLNVKATLWLDIFSSLSKPQAPKFLQLWEALLQGDQTNAYWGLAGNDLEVPHRLRMENLTGCPDDAMLAIARISSLAHWKSLQLRNDCLSYPELIKRGDLIEQKLRRSTSEVPSHSSSNAPIDKNRIVVADIFRQAAILYLHTVLSNSTPVGVPEIGNSVETLFQLFHQLPPSELDRGLSFPLCLAACMTNDSTRRDFFSNRIRGLNESFGNLLQMRRLMEAVWQKRDVRGQHADFRESIQEQGMKLLLI